MLAGLGPSPARADPIRIATYHLDLSRDGPGLLLRDILRGEDAQIQAILQVLTALNADILVLQDLDHDAQRVTLAALADALAAQGTSYPHRFAAPPNAGLPTGVDVDGDGRLGGARDAHGYGRFRGQGGMAVLSRFPITLRQDFSALLWADLPGSSAADVTPAAALPVLRLHSVAAWDLLIETDQGPLRLMTSHASAPVFDGPEDRNGLRNADELRFWHLILDGWQPAGAPAPDTPFILLGTFNVDPTRGEGRRDTLRALLAHPALQDPVPPDPVHGLNTVDWPEPRPGDLRVDYLLPSQDLIIDTARTLWTPDTPLLDPDTLATASAHRPVYADIRLP